MLYSGRVCANCALGTEGIPESDSIKTPGLYIDVDHPAPCSGELTAWHYCYYEPFATRRITYTVQLGVWRLNPQSNLFSKVGEMEFTERLGRRQDDFECDDILLQGNEYIQIEKGDYLGVILGTPTLPMAASFTGSHLLWATSVTDLDVQSVAADGGNLEELRDSTVHISAEIGEAHNTQPTCFK